MKIPVTSSRSQIDAARLEKGGSSRRKYFERSGIDIDAGNAMNAHFQEHALAKVFLVKE